MAAYVGHIRSAPESEGFNGYCRHAPARHRRNGTGQICSPAHSGVSDLLGLRLHSWHFLSQFLYVDLILNNQIKTGLSRFPLNLLLDYQNNLNAADHPLDAKGKPTNLGKQSHGYLVDVSLGQTKNRNDVQFGYAFEREEQDAIISSFAESEIRAPTNILEHRIYGLWKIRANTTAAFTMWIGRTLNSNLQHAVVAPGTVPGTVEPWLKRLPFDMIYTF